MSTFLIVSSSLNPDSNSRRLCRAAYEELSRRVDSVDWLDLQEIELPMCDGGASYSHPNVAAVTQKVRDAKCILLGIPVYNYAYSAAAKNLIELTGKAWTDTVVGFLCAAGGRMSYMSVMSLANSLMLDFRTLIIPRFVYAHRETFAELGKSDSEIHERVVDLVESAVLLTQALHKS